jgi:signal-transduction protein with cAMP-binding, CBS, and nucleotidyltransferase domain
LARIARAAIDHAQVLPDPSSPKSGTASGDIDMRIGEICTRSVVTCARDASALDVALLMRERHVGDVVVTDVEDGKAVPVGIVTDRDLVVEVMARGVAPQTIQAGDLMVGALATASESELAHDAVWHMRGKGIRRLPVVDARGHLIGILTADDLARALAEELVELTRLAAGQPRLEQARLESLDKA